MPVGPCSTITKENLEEAITGNLLEAHDVLEGKWQGNMQELLDEFNILATEYFRLQNEQMFDVNHGMMDFAVRIYGGFKVEAK